MLRGVRSNEMATASARKIEKKAVLETDRRGETPVELEEDSWPIGGFTVLDGYNPGGYVC